MSKFDDKNKRKLIVKLPRPDEDKHYTRDLFCKEYYTPLRDGVCANLKVQKEYTDGFVPEIYLDAEDLTNTIFLQFVKYIDAHPIIKWSSSLDLRLILQKIAHNRIVDYYEAVKKKKEGGGISCDEFNDEVEVTKNTIMLTYSREDTPEESLLSEERLYALYESVESLPRPLKEVFNIVHIIGLDRETSAKELGISYSALRKREQRMRDLLMPHKEFGNG